jgi:hypothetical protein
MEPIVDMLSPEYVTQWNVVIQRTTIDPEFREKLIRNPKSTLEDVGILIEDGEVIVHEFDPQERHLFLPPLVTNQGVIHQTITNQVRQQVAPYSKEPPSDPIKGIITAALITEDSRVFYGKTTIEED